MQRACAADGGIRKARIQVEDFAKLLRPDALQSLLNSQGVRVRWDWHRATYSIDGNVSTKCLADDANEDGQQ